jgi:hypothetical protein
MYSCNAVGCFKGKSAPKFQKPETLTQHIKESHNSDTIYACPIKSCNFEPSKLDHIAIHAHWMHTKTPSKVGARGLRLQDHDASVDAVINAASWKYFRCPVWNCRKFVSGGHKKVSAHLLAHLPIELENVRDELAFDGYEIHNVHGLVALSTDTFRASSVKIKCPACEVRCESDVNFRHHIEANYMLARSLGMREHFETWRADVISWTIQVYIEHVSHRPCWLDRGIHIRERLFGPGREPLKCSYSTCSFHLRPGTEQHPSFLRPAEEIVTDLWLHRKRILRHYPQFITHPMFQE